MGFDVYWNPSAASVGGVARQAGLGEYSKFQQQLIEQKNTRLQQERMQQQRIEAQKAAQRTGIAAQQQSQLLGIAAQQKRDKDYQAFQREMDDINFIQGIAGAEHGAGLQMDMVDYRNQLGIENQDRKYSQNAWQSYVGSIQNWNDWGPEQQSRFQNIQSDVMALMSSGAFTDSEKAEGVRQAIGELQSIQSTVVPRIKTEAENRKAQGRGIGDVWFQPGIGYMMGTKDGGEVIQSVPKYDEYAKHYAQGYDALTQIVGGKKVPPTAAQMDEYMDQIDQRYKAATDPRYQRPQAQEEPQPDRYKLEEPHKLNQYLDIDSPEVKQQVATPEGRFGLYKNLTLLAGKTNLTPGDLQNMTPQQAYNLLIAEKRLREKYLKRIAKKY